MKLRFIALTVLACFIYACASKTAATSSSQASATTSAKQVTSAQPVPLGSMEAPKPQIDSKNKTESPELLAGKMSYKTNCAKCHDLFSPKDFNKDQWAPILVSMQKKAHLTDAEMAPITNYIYSQL